MNRSQHAENLGTGGHTRFERTCLMSELVAWASSPIAPDDELEPAPGKPFFMAALTILEPAREAARAGHGGPRKPGKPEETDGQTLTRAWTRGGDVMFAASFAQGVAELTALRGALRATTRSSGFAAFVSVPEYALAALTTASR
jgi:hypothetical protein